MKAKRFLTVLLTVVMLIGMLPASVFAYFERGTSLDVSAEGKTYSLFSMITDMMNFSERPSFTLRNEMAVITQCVILVIPRRPRLIRYLP